MENKTTIWEYIKLNCDAVLRHDTPEHQQIWKELLALHPADIAQLIVDLSKDDQKKLFLALPQHVRLGTFTYFPDTLKIYTLSVLDDKNIYFILSHTPIDELTDLFDKLSDQELEYYMALLNKRDRKKVLSIMKFDPESAGGIMETDVLTLVQDFTVEKSIHLLQRLQPRFELHQHIYVTDQDNHVVGHIRLEDLVLQRPQRRLFSFLRKNLLVIPADEDRESIAQKMRHYNLMIVPVVGEDNYFLGAIPSDILVDIIEQEASEDVYKMSAMPAIKYSYFETSFFKMLFDRSYILIGLLLAQSLSSMIIKRYELLLVGFLTRFITMLISTGGNSSSQTSAVVIQGMASGEITQTNMWRFLRRELCMAGMIALILSVFSFGRVYLTEGNLLGSLVVSLSLFFIVLLSVVLGSSIPLILRKLKMDPAFAAGPFLATLMDILGLVIYCYISSFFLA